MAREQVFPVSIAFNGSVIGAGLGTLCFPYKAPLDEEAVLDTSIEFDEGSVIKADSESLRKYRSWTLVVGPVLHKNGTHCIKYKVFVQNFIETPIKPKKKNR